MSFNLLLSGGVARGIGHLGVIQSLEEAGLKPDAIAGVSSGSIVGAFYAKGLSPTDILTIVKEQRLWHYLRPALSRGGLFTLKRTAKVLKKYLGEIDFQDLAIPLTVSAVALRSRELHFFNSGPVTPALLASSSVPMLFEPYDVEGERYMDGGIIENTPISAFEEMKKYIAVDVMMTPPVMHGNRFTDILERSIEIITTRQIKKPEQENLIQPFREKYYSVFDLKHADEMFEAGYQACNTWLVSNKERFL